MHVGVVAAEKLACTVAGEVFDHIDLLAAAIVAVTRVTFSILIRKHAAHGFEHRRRDDVLRGDKLDSLALAG